MNVKKILMLSLSKHEALPFDRLRVRQAECHDIRASSVQSFLKLTLIAVLAFGLAGCGTKTELLKPDGKPTPGNERDPSQPPSPIAR
ncbi:MAG TPA: hypothetical protein VHT03_02990 [Rhizomicrobium sp.]|jgi:predicted small lipoprotein YifL|nr:hypothetical protein [Rhizomicrobium sp.]